MDENMSEKILFSLEKCIKCNQTKELLEGRDDIKIITYPHEINEWNEKDLNEAKSHDVFKDLQITAPILWIDGEKIIGYLRIRKWLQDYHE
jgi:glutaredoxin